MNHARGLAPKTRSSMFLRTVRRLMLEQLSDRPVIIFAIKPEDVRRFVARQSELYSTPASAAPPCNHERDRAKFCRLPLRLRPI
jgi:integrase/recombinase XerC